MVSQKEAKGTIKRAYITKFELTDEHGKTVQLNSKGWFTDRALWEVLLEPTILDLGKDGLVVGIKPDLEQIYAQHEALEDDN